MPRLGNRLLAFFHGTDDARGYRQWQQAGGRLRKSARAFGILAPITVKKTETDDSGTEVEWRVVVGFKAIPVFRDDHSRLGQVPVRAVQAAENRCHGLGDDLLSRVLPTLERLDCRVGGVGELVKERVHVLPRQRDRPCVSE